MFDTFAYLITSLRKDFTEFCNEKLQEMGLTQGLLFYSVCGKTSPVFAQRADGSPSHGYGLLRQIIGKTGGKRFSGAGKKSC